MHIIGLLNVVEGKKVERGTYIAGPEIEFGTPATLVRSPKMGLLEHTHILIYPNIYMH